MTNLFDSKRHFRNHNQHIYTTLFLIFSATILFAQRPTISSFSPLSGPVGTTVTITGDHFSAVTSQNVVYFGPAKAVVQSATGSELTVLVPTGAAYHPITVTNTAAGLTAWSSKPFQITFPGGDNYLSSASFGNEVVALVQNAPRAIAIGDLDGDGKPDVATIGDFGGSGYYLSIVRNTSSPRHLSFGQTIDSSYAGFAGQALALADINGDGLFDLISSGGQTLSIYKNISTPGNIRFSLALAASGVSAFANSLEVGDMDNDGRTDLVFFSGSTPTVIRNLSSLDSIILGNPETILPPPNYPGDNLRLKLADFDGDGNIDIAMVYTYADSIVVVRNKSTPANFVFDQVFKYRSGGDSRPFDLCIADMDGDGMLDICFTNNGYNYIQILKNITTAGNLDFDPNGGGFCCVTQSGNIISGDINGDGKPDLAFAGYICCFPGDIDMLLNNSVPCNSILNSTTVFDGQSFTQMIFSDIDGDGKPDLITGKNVQQAIAVRRNDIGQVFRNCLGDTTVLPASIVGPNYQWQQNPGGGFVNIADDAQFSGTNSPFLQIKNIPASFNNSTYRCIAGSDTGNVMSVFVNITQPLSLSIVDCPKQVCSGDPTTVVYAAAQNAGHSAVYQWQDSTNAQGWKNIEQGVKDTLHYHATVIDSKIRCLLRSNSQCAVPDSAISNTITIPIAPGIAPVNSITGVTTVNAGQSSTITATPANGGNWPQYQWQDSTGVAGWANMPGGNSANIIYIPDKTGDKIRCVLRSTDVCAMPKTVTSNVLVFMVNLVTAIYPISANNYRIYLFPNPSYTVLNVDSLKLSDNWQLLEIFAINGQRQMAISLSGLTRKTIDVSFLPQGIFLAILRRKNNQVAYYKFVKLIR